MKRCYNIVYNTVPACFIKNIQNLCPRLFQHFVQHCFNIAYTTVQTLFNCVPTLHTTLFHFCLKYCQNIVPTLHTPLFQHGIQQHCSTIVYNTVPTLYIILFQYCIQQFQKNAKGRLKKKRII